MANACVKSSGNEWRHDDGSGAKYLRMEPPMISVVSLVLAEPTKNDPVVLGLSIINVLFQLTGSIKTNIDTDINVKHQAWVST